MRVGGELHGAGEQQGQSAQDSSQNVRAGNGICVSLDHVEYLLGAVQPHVVVGDSHGLERYFLGVLEVGVRPPDLVEPL